MVVRFSSSRFGVAGGSEPFGGDEWKRRDAPKHAPYLEPVSPPDNHVSRWAMHTYYAHIHNQTINDKYRLR